VSNAEQIQAPANIDARERGFGGIRG